MSDEREKLQNQDDPELQDDDVEAHNMSGPGQGQGLGYAGGPGQGQGLGYVGGPGQGQGLGYAGGPGRNDDDSDDDVEAHRLA